MPPPSLQWFALCKFLASLPPSRVWEIQSSRFLAFLSRLIPAEILNILLYPWTVHPNLVDIAYIDNPFRQFDEDLISLYYHPRLAIRHAFLNHRCNLFDDTFSCPHLGKFLEFERSICHISLPFPDLQFFSGDPLFLFPPSSNRVIALVCSYLQYFLTHHQPPPAPVFPSPSLTGVDVDDLEFENLESLEDSDDENMN